MTDQSSSEGKEPSEEFWAMVNQFEFMFDRQPAGENAASTMKESLKTHAACMALIADRLIEKVDQLMKK